MNINSLIANLLDSVAIHADKVLPIDGAGVFYRENDTFFFDAWKEGTSRYLHMGRYMVELHLKG
jgi:hypothetical protein